LALQFAADLFFGLRSINPGSDLLIEASFLHGASVRGESMLCWRFFPYFLKDYLVFPFVCIRFAEMRTWESNMDVPIVAGSPLDCLSKFVWSLWCESG
jgi:hypothetical protein